MRSVDMARKLKDAAHITVQMVLESPDEVIMIAETPLVEFPRKSAFEAYPAVREMKGILLEDYLEYVNFANDKIRNWVESEGI